MKHPEAFQVIYEVPPSEPISEFTIRRVPHGVTISMGHNIKITQQWFHIFGGQMQKVIAIQLPHTQLKMSFKTYTKRVWFHANPLPPHSGLIEISCVDSYLHPMGYYDPRVCFGVTIYTTAAALQKLVEGLERLSKQEIEVFKLPQMRHLASLGGEEKND